jgi:anti-sigma regulatory factor (Ser/Thr protein kinase)
VHTSWPFAMSLPNDLHCLSELRRALDQWLESQKVDAEARAAVILATHEAAANAVQHANSREPITVNAGLDNGNVIVEVQDTGQWTTALFDNEERGRGLIMIAALMQDVAVETEGPGTTLRMTRLLADESQHVQRHSDTRH